MLSSVPPGTRTPSTCASGASIRFRIRPFTCSRAWSRCVATSGCRYVANAGEYMYGDDELIRAMLRGTYSTADSDSTA